MTDQELREALKKEQIYNQYLLMGEEVLLIDNAVRAIKQATKVDESFDLETFSISEASIEDVVSKLYLMPLASARRLLIIKNLEELTDKDLKTFAQTISNIRTANCVILTFQMLKGDKKSRYTYQDIIKLFPHAQYVIFTIDQELIHKTIMKRIKRENLALSSSVIQYLEDEFSDDITGLKNEFEKIENYLTEAKTLNNEDIKDLAQGLGYLSKYQLGDEFWEGKTEISERFEKLKPYLHSYAEIVDALTRTLVRRLRTKKNAGDHSNSFINEILDEIVVIDRKIKISSYFDEFMLELFLLTNAGSFRKGVLNGRKMA